MSGPTKIRTGALVSESLRSIRQRPWLIVRSYALPILLSAGATFSLIYLLSEYGVNPEQSTFGSDASDSVWPWSILIFMPGFVLIGDMVLFVGVAIATVPYVRHLLGVQHQSNQWEHRKSMRVIFSVWATQMMMVAFGLAFEVTMMIGPFLALFWTASDLPGWGNYVPYVYPIAIVALPIVGVRLSLMPIIAALTGRIQPLRSWRLTKGNTFRLLGTYLLWIAVIYIALMISMAVLVATVIAINATVSAASPDLTVFQYLSVPFVLFGFLFFLLFPIVSITALGTQIYKELDQRTGSLDTSNQALSSP